MSEDWEKDFDLDMTEEEVQMALSKIEASGEVGVELTFVTFTRIFDSNLPNVLSLVKLHSK